MECLSINRVELQGRVGTVRIMPVGNSLAASFSVMTEYARKTQSGDHIVESTWMHVTAYEENNVSLDGLDRGEVVHLTGRLRNTKYIDSCGCEKIFTEVVAESLRVLELV